MIDAGRVRIPAFIDLFRPPLLLCYASFLTPCSQPLRNDAIKHRVRARDVTVDWISVEMNRIRYLRYNLKFTKIPCVNFCILLHSLNFFTLLQSLSPYTTFQHPSLCRVVVARRNSASHWTPPPQRFDVDTELHGIHK